MSVQIGPIFHSSSCMLLQKPLIIVFFIFGSLLFLQINFRLGSNGILSSSIGSLTPPLKGLSMGGTALAPRRQPENTEQTQGSTPCCPVCMGNYEQELAKLVAKEFEKSSSDSKPEVQQALPQWMQIAKLTNGGTKPSDQQQVLTFA